MALVPNDYPQRLAAAGLTVQVFAGWESHGGSADHRAVVLHHTASSAHAAPADDAAYCHHGGSDAPLYNVLVDRTGVCWVLAREKANSSGKINSTALAEAREGRAGSVSAGARGLGDDTSDNAGLFAISAQNDGVGEQWSDALNSGVARCTAVTLECLGLEVGHTTIHRVLTGRKIDTCGPGCPQDWQPLVRDAMGGGSGPPGEVPEMWLDNREVQRGDTVLVALPHDRKSAHVRLLARDSDGAAAWASQSGKSEVGLWSGGNDWENWVPPNYPVDADVDGGSYFVTVENRGPGVLMVATYGT